MNVPLSWLAEYVALPDDIQKLTDRLTMIGHMLDKIFIVDTETVIDLELRGNRADLFGLIGIARDISAACNVPLKLPDIATLPKTQNNSTLITVEAFDLVHRFSAITAKVRVQPSPDWMIKKLAAYGMASINNVVDITNFVMVETGIPLHAFDKRTLAGERLIIRRGRKNEHMRTFMGENIILGPEDIVLADEKQAQATTIIGSKSSGVTEKTTEILLEAAIYDHANVRRTSRRLGVRTEAGNRLEKHLDPNAVEFALSRAMYLLEQLACASVTSKTANYYPNVRKSIPITLPVSETHRLGGIFVSGKEQKEILERLGCIVQENADSLAVCVPTFRTDIAEKADLVEEILRIVGYENIPSRMLAGELPPEQTLPRIKQEKRIKDILVNLQLSEVITSTFVPTMSSSSTIHIQNAPDPKIATLRPSLIPNLLEYAKRLLYERAERILIFEIGNVFFRQKKTYTEERRLGILISGSIDTKSYGRTPRPLGYFDLKGILEALSDQLGIAIPIKIETIDTNIFATEVSLETLPRASVNPSQLYHIAPPYPPVIEDVSFLVDNKTKTGDMLHAISSFDPIISDVKLLDAYQNKRTFRIIYQDPKKNLSTEDVRPVREKLIQNIEKTFAVSLV
jgi:phenylalanyl-tRNA synthetase beta chain